jgi:hypothetical protein
VSAEYFFSLRIVQEVLPDEIGWEKQAECANTPSTDARSELVYRRKIEAKRHIVKLKTFVFRSLTQDELPGSLGKGMARSTALRRLWL